MSTTKPPSQRDKVERFRALHAGDGPLLLPNAWDAGTARLFASMGFEAVATTSGGFAATLGRLDGNVSADEALVHAADIAGAVRVPVNADLENGFADEPDAVAALVARALGTGVAGLSIEDYAGHDEHIYDIDLAVDRVAAAAEAAHSGPAPVLLTARAEGHLHGRTDLADTIARLQRYQEAGADVLYAPGASTIDEIRAIVTSVDRPVNVLMLPGVAPVAELAEVGVARVSVGSAFSLVGLAAVAEAARELLEDGTGGFWSSALPAFGLARHAFADRT
jgi:2-methylisocitrate lyase-like PEP mutase family enzyme